MSATNEKPEYLWHEFTSLPIITLGESKVLVVTWTINFIPNLNEKHRQEETIDSERFYFAGYWWKMSLEINSKLETRGVLKLMDSRIASQVSYIIFVFDSTRTILDCWNQASTKSERKKDDDEAPNRGIPINETPTIVSNKSFYLSKKSKEDGCFTLCCQLSLYRNYLNEHLKKQKDADYADVTVMTEGKIMKAHRFMLASHSSAFRDWLKNGDSVIRLQDFDSEVVEAMLAFIYSKRIPNVEILAVDLLKMAEKYDLYNFKNQCEKSLCEKVSIENAVRLQALSEDYNLERLKQKTAEYVNDNIKAIQATAEWKKIIREYWGQFEKEHQNSRKRNKTSSM